MPPSSMHQASAFPRAQTTPDGRHIVFCMDCHDGRQHHVACETGLVLPFVAHLLRAQADAAAILQVPQIALLPQGWETFVHDDKVLVRFLMTDASVLPFALGAADAERMSCDLALAAVVVSPPSPADVQ